MLIIVNELSFHAPMYDLRDKTVEMFQINNCIEWYSNAKDYAESCIPKLW
jgi:hypothetical protein